MIKVLLRYALIRPSLPYAPQGLMSSSKSLTWSSFGRQPGLRVAIILILVLCFFVSAHDGLVEPTSEQKAKATVHTSDFNDRPDNCEESILLFNLV